MKQHLISLVTLLISVLTLIGAGYSAAPSVNVQPRAQFLVEFRGARLPDNLSARIAALGGTVVDAFPELKIAIVADLTDAKAAALRAQSDVTDVTNDVFVSWDELSRFRPPVPYLIELAATPEIAQAYPFQWHMRTIGAHRAWQAGYLGNSDVRIAIIDSGIDPTHPDLLGRIDASRSISFCTQEDPLVQQEFPGYPAWTDLLNHGTFVASIASSNANVVAGVTSSTTLMAVKWGGITPGCSLSNILRSIVFSANNGADVINISAGLGNAVPIPRAGQKGWFHYAQQTVQYALQKGVSAVVVSGGNAANDLDHNANAFNFFCDVPGVICVSATGPTDSGPDFLGPWLEPDTPAFYTNFGASAISVAAPGGNLSFDNSGNIVGIGLVTGACATTDRMFDVNGNLVPGICSAGPYYFAGGIGTSFAAPHVSGLAALLVGQLGHGRHAQVKALIANTSDDLGRPGVDPYYGRGRINVARALGLP